MSEYLPPHVTVRQTGRWWWNCELHTGHGTVTSPSTFVLGRRRAHRKAQRMLARYLRDQQRRAAAFDIFEKDLP